MATYTWTGSGDGTSWNDPTNWYNQTTGESPATSAPSGGDTATIGGATIDDSGSAQLVNASDLTIQGSLTAEQYTDDSTHVASGGTLDVTDEDYGIVESGDLDVEGTVTTTRITDNGSTDIEQSGSMTVSSQDYGFDENDDLTVSGTLTSTKVLIESGGTLTVDNGGEIDIGGGTNSIPSNGQVGIDVEGSGSFDDATVDSSGGFIAVGQRTDADLTVSGGSTVTASYTSLGAFGGGEGSLTITDGSTWSNSGMGGFMDVGGGGFDGAPSTGGSGSLTVSDGSSLTSSTSLTAGVTQDSDGTVEITGQGTTVSTGTSFDVGVAGEGSATIADGAAVEVGASMTAGDQAGATGSIDITGDGTSVTTGSFFQVGYGGEGSATIEDGASLTVGTSFAIGDTATGTATVDITGGETTVDVGTFFDIGYSGQGSVTIEEGASVSVAAVFSVAGGTEGGSGTLDVTDGDTRLDVGGDFDIGLGGDGIATIESGATVSSHDVQIGALDGATGDLTVTGGDTSLTDSTFIAVGGAGTGTLTMSDGATVTESGALVVGVAAGSSGTLDITGEGTSASVGTYFEIGGGGNGTGTIDQGASVEVSEDVIVGGVAGSSGSLTVDGGDTSLSIDGGAYVGDAGTGNLTVSDGATLSVDPDDGAALDIGTEDDGEGTVTITGAATSVTLDAGDGAFVGDAATGTLAVQDGAQLNVATDDPESFFAMTLGNYASGAGTVTVSGAGSTLTVGAGGLSVGDDGTGTVDVSDSGQLNVTDSASGLDIASASGSSGTVVVTGSGSSLTSAGPVYVGDGGTGSLTVAAGAMLTTPSGEGPALDIGSQSTGQGTVTVTDGATALTLEGGDGIIVGDQGTGTLAVGNGASVDVSSADPDAYYAIVLGNTASGSGTVTVDGEGSTLTAGAGGMSVGYAGMGTVTVSGGGTLDVTDTTYGLDIGTTAGSTGTFTVTGDGSTLNADGPLTIGDAGNGTLELDDASTASVEGDVTLGAQDTGDGTLNLSDDNSSLDIDGTLTVGQEGSGTVSLSASDASDLTVTVLMSAAGVKAIGNVLIGNGNGSQDFVTVKDATTIGQDGTASLTLNGAGDGNVGLTTSTFMLAFDAGSTASLDVGANAGGNAVLNVSGQTTIGGDGNATVTIGGLGLGDSSDVITYSLLTSAGAEAVSSITVGKTGSTGIVDLNVSSDMTVGGQGKSSIDMLSGTATVGGTLTLGQSGGSAGTLSLSGNGTVLDANGGDAMVGDQGMGELDVDGDADAEIAGNLDLGAGQGGVGALTVDSTSTLDVGGDLDEAVGPQSSSTTVFGGSAGGASGDPHIHGDYIVGDGGTATDTIMAGTTTIVDGDITVGHQSTGVGTVTVTGADALLTAGTGDVTIGDAGIGTVTVQNGGTFDATANAVTLAAQGGSSGSLAIDGDGSEVDAGTLTVGAEGDATVVVSDGGSLSVGGDMTIADEDGSSGVVTVADAASGLDVGGALQVGNGDKGSLIVDGGTDVSGATTIGVEAGGNGVVTVNGATLTLDGETKVGDAGIGTLLVQQGGTLKADALTLGEQGGSTGALTIDGDGTTAQTAALTVGSAGAGALRVTDGAALTSTADSTIGELVSANVQTAVVTGGAGWTVAGGGLTVGGSGIASLNVSGGGSVSASADVVLGEEGAATGMVEVSGKSADGSTLSNLSFGGTLTVGGSGEGTLAISAGATAGPTSGGTGVIEIGAQTGATGTLSVDGAGSALDGKTLSVGGTDSAAGGTGTLTISNGGVVSVSDAVVWSGGLVTLEGGSLLTDPVTLHAGASVSGFGTLTGDVTDDGSITAVGGLLTLTDAVSGTGSVGFGSRATLAIDDLASAAGGAQQQDFNVPISGFARGDAIDIATAGLGLYTTIDGYRLVAEGADTGLVLTDAGATVATLTLAGDYLTDPFAITAQQGEIAVSIACYCRGTLILTDKGEVAVEALAIGDRVRTGGGALRPVKWIGTRSYSGRFVGGNPDVLPVCFKPGSLDKNVPRRDLWVSPKHAMYLDGVLIPAEHLINGTTILQAQTVEVVDYFHIELNSHDVILAEGAASETFVDDDSRAMFHNAQAYAALYPDAAPIEALYCAPRVEDGFVLEAVRRRLSRRAGSIAASAAPLAA